MLYNESKHNVLALVGWANKLSCHPVLGFEGFIKSLTYIGESKHVSHFCFYTIKTPMLSPSLAYLFAKYGLPPYLVEFWELEQKSKDRL
jgi:hypothetical protein